MDLKPLEKHKMNLGEKMSASWYFEKWWEKVILVVLSVMGLWKIIELII